MTAIAWIVANRFIAISVARSDLPWHLCDRTHGLCLDDDKRLSNGARTVNGAIVVFVPVLATRGGTRPKTRVSRVRSLGTALSLPLITEPDDTRRN